MNARLPQYLVDYLVDNVDKVYIYSGFGVDFPAGAPNVRYLPYIRGPSVLRPD